MLHKGGPLNLKRLGGDTTWRLVIQVLNNGASGVNLVRANFNQAAMANADLRGSGAALLAVGI